VKLAPLATPDLIAPTAWSAPAIATTLRKTIKLKRAKQARLPGLSECAADRRQFPNAA
jgi:hypothetical protein